MSCITTAAMQFDACIFELIVVFQANNRRKNAWF
jgi:hypothetical protein